jgi:molybdopterin converting factor subunit 1
MRITVRFFAVVRDRAGVAQIVVHAEPGATVATVVGSIATQFPAIAEVLPRVAFAVNQTYMDRATFLHDGDELALIPPVSGGCG